MPKFTIKVDGDKMTDVTLHSNNRVPFTVPGAKLGNGKELDRNPGNYLVLCITEFGTPGQTVTCTVSGANDTERQNTGTINDNGKLTLAVDFRLNEAGEVL